MARQQIRPDTPIVFDFVFLFNERFDMYLRKKQPPLKDLKVLSFIYIDSVVLWSIVFKYTIEYSLPVPNMQRQV